MSKSSQEAGIDEQLSALKLDVLALNGRVDALVALQETCRSDIHSRIDTLEVAVSSVQRSTAVKR